MWIASICFKLTLITTLKLKVHHVGFNEPNAPPLSCPFQACIRTFSDLYVPVADSQVRTFTLSCFFCAN